MKQDIESVFKPTKEINQYLKQLYQMLQITVVKFKDTSLHQITKMQQAMKIDMIPFIGQEKKIGREIQEIEK